MNKTLRLVFRNQMGRLATISLRDPKDALTGTECDTVMDSILAKNVFDSNGTDLEAKVRAEVVSRSVDVLEEF